MVTAAERNSELIADLAAKCSALHKPEMMGICRPSAANQAGMLGDRSDVIPVTHPAWFRHRQRALIDRARAPLGFSVLLLVHLLETRAFVPLWTILRHLRRPQGRPASLGKALLENLGIFSDQCVLLREESCAPRWQRHRSN